MQMTNILLHGKFERHCKHKMLISSIECVYIVSLSSTGLSSIRLHFLEFISCSSNENSNNYILIKQINKCKCLRYLQFLARKLLILHFSLVFISALDSKHAGRRCKMNTSFQNAELFQTGIERIMVLTFKNYSINLVTKRQKRQKKNT